MNNFDDFFSTLAISRVCSLNDVINFLVRERLKLTKKRKQSPSKQSTKNNAESVPLISRITPPRRHWNLFRPNRGMRKDLSRSEIHAKCLAVCIRNRLLYATIQEYQWIKDLCKTVQILDDQFNAGKTMEFPRLIPIEKPVDSTNPGPKRYRVIAVQENFIDRMLHSLVARYLQKRFRNTFSENVYGLNSSKSASKAVGNLIAYRKEFLGKTLWTSEVDIRQFFDTVSHSKIRSSLSRHIRKHFGDEQSVDPAAIQVLLNFMDQYSHCKVEAILYERVGVSSLMTEDLKGQLREINGKYGFGIPQGSPFSNLIANVLMSEADEAVEGVIAGATGTGFYARFVDDVIMVHHQKDICNRMYAAYLKSLESLNLFGHPPDQKISTHPREYLDQKTLQPYPWCHPTESQEAHRWVAFLGYHIREDLQVRLRQSTFEKELEKQCSIIEEILNKLNRPSFVENRRMRELQNPGTLSLAFIAQKRLAARTVGLDFIQGKFHLDQRICWNAAFPHLKANMQGSAQLRQLDKNREKQIRKLRARLKEVDLSVSWPEWYKTCRFFGHPFSYYSLVQNNEKASHPKLHIDRFFFDTAY